jgi:hypothetical protein
MAAKENRLVTLDAQRGDSISHVEVQSFRRRMAGEPQSRSSTDEPNIGTRAIDMPTCTRVR